MAPRRQYGPGFKIGRGRGRGVGFGDLTPSIPNAFSAAQWSIADADIGQTASVTINSLPGANGSAITDIEYRIDGGAWTSSGGLTDFNITGLTNGVEVTVDLRAVNGIGNSPDSDDKTVTPTAGVPDAFEAGDWSVADAGSGGAVNVTISALPANNGAAISDIEYRVDFGTWTSSAGTTSFQITGLTDDVEVTIDLRAVNSEGNSADSDDKDVTPTTSITAPSISPQTVSIGSLTKAGYGYIGFDNELTNAGGAIDGTGVGNAILSGNTNTDWAIDSAGKLTPNVGAEDSMESSYALSVRVSNSAGSSTATITINVTSNEITVSKGSEVFPTLLKIQSDTLYGSGLSWAFRAAEYTTGFGLATDTMKNKFWSTSYDLGGTLQSQHADNKAIIRNQTLDMNTCRGVTIKNLEFYDTTGLARIIYLRGQGTAASLKCKFEDLVVHATYRDPEGDYSGGYPGNPGGIRAVTAGNGVQDVQLRRNHIYDIDGGIGHSVKGEFLAYDQYIDKSYSDGVNGGTTGGQTTEFRYERCVWSRMFSLSSDPLGIHPDCCQWSGDNTVVPSWWIMNRVMPGLSRNTRPQVRFTNNRLKDKFQGNFISTGNTKGWFIEAGQDCRADGNVLIQVDPNDAAPAGTPKMQMGDASGLGVGTFVCTHNIVGAGSTVVSPAVLDKRSEVALGLSTSGVGASLDYDDVFDTILANFPTALTDVDDMATYYAMKAAGPADATDPDSGVFGLSPAYVTMPTAVLDETGASGPDHDFDSGYLTGGARNVALIAAAAA